MRRFSTLGVFFSTMAVAGAAAAADPAVTGTILLGQVAPFSGPSVKLAEEYNLGARTYFQALNERGGVNGHRVELRTRDDRYDPAETARQAKALIEQDDVFALFGTVGTGTTLAAVPVATAAGVPLFAPSTGAEALRTPLNRQIFHVRAGYNQEADYIVEQLSTSGLRSVAVLHQDDAFGKAALESVTRALTQRGVKNVGMAAVERDATEVSDIARKLAAGHPQAVILVASYTSSAALIKTMKKQGYAGQFVATSYVGGKSLADELGGEGSGVWISEVVPFPGGRWPGAAARVHPGAAARRRAAPQLRVDGGLPGRQGLHRGTAPRRQGTEPRPAHRRPRVHAGLGRRRLPDLLLAHRPRRHPSG